MDAKLLEQLRDPKVYSIENAGEVEIHQTHLSVVCLVGEVAYKLKKPVQFPFVDFSTLDRRKFYCEEEVRLNRRLCPDVYQGVVPLRRLSSGGLTLQPEGSGEIIDFAVCMRRLPAERMMDHLLAQDKVASSHVIEIAKIMAEFHRTAERNAAVLEAGDGRKLERYAIANFEETRDLTGAFFDPDLHGILEERTHSDFSRILPTLERRAGEGKAVDGHGDLHARNICLCDPIAIYDCIEFNPGFRCGDTATENAFLVMDLRYHGRPDLAAEYLESYLAETGDQEQRALMPALVRYRAMVRAKVSAIAAGERELAETEHREAMASVRRHFHLTAATAIEEDQAWFVVACGLPGAGKSHVFSALSRETGWPCFASDPIRKELAGVEAEVPLGDEHYSEAFSDLTYREIVNRAADRIESGRVVLLDANYRQKRVRAAVRAAAEKAGARTAFVWIDTEEKVILDRLGQRETAGDEISDADVAVFRKLKAEFEAPSATECDRLITIDGAAPLPTALAKILSNLMQKKGQA